jgi:quinol monooxygenase YgiN
MAAERRFRMQIRMKVRTGRDGEFEDGWLALASAAQAHPANVDQWLARSSQEPGVYFVVSDWTDEEGYRDFLSSPGFRRTIVVLRPFLADDTMSASHVVHHLPGAGNRGRATPP